MNIRRRSWLIATAVMGGLMIVALLFVASRIPLSSETLRRRVIETLSDRFDAEVELNALTFRLFPRLRAEGAGLVVHQKHHDTDLPPLISIDKFEVHADLLGLLRRHVARVTLSGLDIQIAPRDGDEEARELDAAATSSENHDPSGDAMRVVVDELEAPEARLLILPRDRAKQPKAWYLHRLRMRSVGLERSMPFDALLTNAVPPGQIETRGSFGPWQRDNPGNTPLNGRFTYANADLSVFDGISGILSARGTFNGALARIEVNGETDTPDFTVTLAGHAVPLNTTYHAIVDGTNGNTTLDPVNAQFLGTSVVARGGVYDVEHVEGRVVRLDVTIDQGRLQDVMLLAVRTPTAPMTGVLDLVTTFVLPPGKRDAIEKLQLEGQFAIAGGRFTDGTVQTRINELSEMARGKEPSAESVPTRAVPSNFAGRFKLDAGVLALPIVTFDVPGAVVEMSGRYVMKRETVDFSGNLFMDAKLSEVTGGWKSVLLKAVDPLFRKQGRTVIPLKISGSRRDPKFGVDMRRAVTRNTPREPGTLATPRREIRRPMAKR